MLPYSIRKIYKPEIFQGYNKSRNYFEGWYFKLVDRDANRIFAIIPGVSISGIKDENHAFIQIMDGKNASSKYFRFSYSDFNYSTRKFQISIGNNSFSASNIKLDLSDGNEIYRADLEFTDLNTWPRTILSPGAMGWYTFVPFMECYHGVVSMNHLIGGKASFSGENIDFSGGKGYIEKDWGLSFPKGWIWMQSNHFKDTRTSIMFSAARIPWRGKSFTGFICGLLYAGKIHVFATYNGAKVKDLHYTSDSFKCILENINCRLMIESKKEQSASLLSPILGAMDGRINESIDAKVIIRLERISNIKAGTKKIIDNLIYEDSGYAGGLEIINPEML